MLLTPRDRTDDYVVRDWWEDITVDAGAAGVAFAALRLSRCPVGAARDAGPLAPAAS
jgi:hypothetical protein